MKKLFIFTLLLFCIGTLYRLLLSSVKILSEIKFTYLVNPQANKWIITGFTLIFILLVLVLILILFVIYKKYKVTDLHNKVIELQEEIDNLEINKDALLVGLHDFEFAFDTSEEYKESIKEVRSKQKELVKEKLATSTSTTWTVNNSEAKGRAMTNQYIKIMLRAFNGECDVAIAKVNWKNFNKMNERISKSFKTINKFGEKQGISITNEYLFLKLDELDYAFAYAEKRQEEKEEQRRIQAQIREEEEEVNKLKKEKKKAEQDEKEKRLVYEKALKELSNAHGDELEKLQLELKELKNQLDLAESTTRAISQAQITKAGFVYIISNIGSLGENVYKIGMTRRLEPLDRVKELSNASLPFPFDVHAMISCDNAPELENKLHKELARHKVNLVRKRREFFNIDLEKIVEIVEKNHGKVHITKLAEAREYEESEILRKELYLEHS